MRTLNGRIYKFGRPQFEEKPYRAYCTGYEKAICVHPSESMRDEIRKAIEVLISQSSLHFPRVLMKELDPIIQNVNISLSRAAAKTILITFIPYPIDAYRQFLTPGYGIFNALN
jgi:hypothetical protein